MSGDVQRLDDPNRQVVGLDPAGATADDTADTGGGDDLDAMTKDELLAEADALGIEASSSMTKAQIIEAIRAG